MTNIKKEERKKEKQYTKWQIKRAVSSALVDAYFKTVKGWEARIFSGNFNMFIEDKTIEYLENPPKED